MARRMDNSISSTPDSLLIGNHCATIRRKGERIDTAEMTSIFDDFVKELHHKPSNPAGNLTLLNEIVHSLNNGPLPALASLHSHQFFILVRNTIQNFLQKAYTTYQLSREELSVMRSSTFLLQHLIEALDDVSVIISWISDSTFLSSLTNCLQQINTIANITNHNQVVKEISRLLSLFADIQERLPWERHQSLFIRLLQPTITCLTSYTYVELFKSLKPNAASLAPLEKLFLIKCPYFLESYYGQQIEATIEQVLEIMLPRYVSILDRHTQTITQWSHPMMRSVRYLLNTLVFAQGFFTLHLPPQSIRSLIDHLLLIIDQIGLLKKIGPSPRNQETLLIEATLIVLSVLVYESDALDYMKKRKAVTIFQKLISVPCESIVLYSYMMMAYTMDDADIDEAKVDLSRLTVTILNLLYDAVEKRKKANLENKLHIDNTDRDLIQLTEILKGLMQHDLVKREILRQNALTFLIECGQNFHGLSKQFTLECLWSLSFNQEAAQFLRKHGNFISALKDIPKPEIPTGTGNNLRRSTSFSRRRVSTITQSDEQAKDGIYKMADGLLWNLITESDYRESEQGISGKQKSANNQNFKYDIMVSYNYDDKDLAYRIQGFLNDEGFSMWFEQDDFYGRTMETQAEGIDNSRLVIICMSSSYKRDNQCKAAMDYAISCRRPILPVILRKDFVPSGWLAPIVDKRTPINFGVIDFTLACAGLLREVNQCIKRRPVETTTKTTKPTHVEQKPQYSKTNGAYPQRSISTENNTSSASTPTNFDTGGGSTNIQLRAGRSKTTRSQSDGTNQTSNRFTSTPATMPRNPTTATDKSRNTLPAVTTNASKPIINEAIRLPDEFIKRDTSNATYRSTSLRFWTREDILDFLHDSKLHIMMPICESMTGQALIRFFRMCQKKPNHIYDQLNEEMRTRFKSTGLPMALYTRFLSEIDNILESMTESSPAPKAVLQQPLMTNGTQATSLSMTPDSMGPRGVTATSPQNQQNSSFEIISEPLPYLNEKPNQNFLVSNTAPVTYPNIYLGDSFQIPTDLTTQATNYTHHVVTMDQRPYELPAMNGF